MNQLNEEKFKVGERVHYVDGSGKTENGIVKSKHPSSANVVFVVYACDGNWDHYQRYTGCSTQVSDLRKGWV